MCVCKMNFLPWVVVKTEKLKTSSGKVCNMFYLTLFVCATFLELGRALANTQRSLETLALELTVCKGSQAQKQQFVGGGPEALQGVEVFTETETVEVGLEKVG